MFLYVLFGLFVPPVAAENKKGTVFNEPPECLKSRNLQPVSIGVNPFYIDKKNRLVPGGTFTVCIKDGSFKDKITSVYLTGSARRKFRNLSAYIQYNGLLDRTELNIVIPKWKGELETFLAPSFWSGMFRSHKAQLVIVYKDDNERLTCSTPIDIEIPEPFWAWFWAIFTVLLVTGVTWGMVNRRRSKGNKISFWKTPLYLAVTPGNRYSLSLMQVVLWTYVIIFGLAFVWKITQTFLVITPQVLMLLGIGGGTAAMTRIQTASKLQQIPLRYHKLIKEDRKPKLSDLIATGDDTPVIMKFQMLFFTIIIAGNVFSEIFNEYSFPVLSGELVALMGLSSAVYLGNDISRVVKVDDLTAKFKEFDDYITQKETADPSWSYEAQKREVLLKDKKFRELKEMISAFLN